MGWRRPSLNKQARTTVLNDGIIAIDTEYLRPLQDASHLIVEGGRGAFVDTGTNDSVPLLLDALGQQGLDVADVDYVFLTHIHLDHAGGAGELMRQSGIEASTLRENVTSPNGTTYAALQVLMAEGGLEELMRSAVKAADTRST